MSDRLTPDRDIRDPVEASDDQYSELDEHTPEDVLLVDSAALWLSHYCGQAHSTSTIDNKIHHISLFSRWCLKTEQEPQDLNSIEIERFLSDCHLAESSMRGVYTTLNLYYSHLEKADLIGKNPVTDADKTAYTGDGLKTNGDTDDLHYADASDITYMLNNLGSPKYRNEIIVQMLWQTGIRAEEAETISTDDINLENQSMTVYSSKTGRNRDVYYRRSLALMLDHWISNLRDSMTPSGESDRLLISHQHPSLSASSIQRVVRDAAGDPEDPESPQEIVATDANGSPEFRLTPHSIRSGFAVRCVKNGMDIKRLRDLLGHTSIDRTEIYLKFADDDVEDAARTYAPTSP